VKTLFKTKLTISEFRKITGDYDTPDEDVMCIIDYLKDFSDIISNKKNG